MGKQGCFNPAVWLRAALGRELPIKILRKCRYLRSLGRMGWAVRIGSTQGAWPVFYRYCSDFEYQRDVRFAYYTNMSIYIYIICVYFYIYALWFTSFSCLFKRQNGHGKVLKMIPASWKSCLHGYGVVRFLRVGTPVSSAVSSEPCPLGSDPKGGASPPQSRIATSPPDLGPQKVASWKGNGVKPLFQGNLGR